MQISFLLGPAGTGKTFRCLDDIRGELLACPDGPPLIFLSPKQSTFQLERQLLERGDLTGYSRLRIVSFERLAEWVFEQLRMAAPKFLSEQGRVMVLRAILNQTQDRLTVFKTAARRLGFAEEMGRQIREFQNHGLTPARIRQLAGQIGQAPEVEEKLRDLACIYEEYLHWLAARDLRDADAQLTVAAERLEAEPPGALEIGGLWLDGFAQLTPQELQLLMAVLRTARRATLAFCLDPETEAKSSISSWYLVAHTFARCRSAIEQHLKSAQVTVERLSRRGPHSRFAGSLPLRGLERHWPGAGGTLEPDGSVRAVQCANPEAEAVFCAREILKFVRGGGRYRDTALLLRNFENDYPAVLRRVFDRYRIPFFLDHRESVAHHPLAELTRGALRTIAFNWKHADWFAVLKSGLVSMHPHELDHLENAALAHGWDAAAWRNGFRSQSLSDLDRLNRLRVSLVEPFVRLAAALGPRPEATRLVAELRALWETLSVEEQLTSWSEPAPAHAVHSTVWDQMNSWLDDLTLAFAGQCLAIAEWLPILESGLSSLSVGVIPPALDQVLIGSVDRSRNPDLRMVFVPGLNERVFPAPPATDRLLSETDRAALLETGSSLGDIPALRLAAEQFYGYIACTRARETLILSFSRTRVDGSPLNPSRFVSQIQRIFPSLAIDSFAPPARIDDVEHPCELTALGCRLEDSDVFPLATPDPAEELEPETARRLHGAELNISVSSLERFASCPYRFFLEQGLRLRERDEFLLDIREQGSFQHEVLAAFHEELKAEGLKWRQLTPAQGRARIGRIADEKIQTYRDGLLVANEQNRFTAGNYKASLQNFIEVVIGWFQSNRFDPEYVEFGFGKGSDLPGWRVPLAGGGVLVLRGRIDRIDLYKYPNGEAACVIVDYKSGLKKPDPVLLHHGVQQQLPGYLLALTRVGEIAAEFKVKKITAAGCFLLPLSPRYERSAHRDEALHGKPKRAAYASEGFFDREQLPLLDDQWQRGGSGQFQCRLNNDGQPRSGSFNALPTEHFERILARSEELMRKFGEAIYAGRIAIFPHKHKGQTACEYCRMQTICRFDPWTQKYNMLRPPQEQSTAQP